MNTDNYMELIFPATSQNEAFARVCAAAFAAAAAHVPVV